MAVPFDRGDGGGGGVGKDKLEGRDFISTILGMMIGFRFVIGDTGMRMKGGSRGWMTGSFWDVKLFIHEYIYSC